MSTVRNPYSVVASGESSSVAEPHLRLVPKPCVEPATDLLAPHLLYLLAKARRITRNEANAHDLVQNTCIHTLEFFARGGEPPENLRGWLVVVMRNQWIGIVRHHRVRSNARAELADRGTSDSGLYESRALHDQIQRAWNGLPDQAQDIARQCLIEGDSYEDVSRRFGMTTGGIACSIHRTREHLRQTLFGKGVT